MQTVEFSINNKQYSLSCSEEEKSKLLTIVSKLDNQIKTLANKFPLANDSLLFIINFIMNEEGKQNNNLPNNSNNNEEIEEYNNFIKIIIENINKLSSKISN
jgi:cell division protein ZapA (FtsZ GTPase activity inhibitor)